MIPSLPFDPALPHLATLLDGDAMTSILAEGMTPGDQPAIRGCQPRYARYKPGTSCLVQYDVTFVEANGVLATIGAHIWMYADDRGQVRMNRSRMRRLVERAAPCHHDVPFESIRYLSAIHGLFQVYPIDYELPSLARTANVDDAQRLVRKMAPGFENATVTPAPELIRYKPGRKALYRYGVDNAPVETMYGKVRSDNLAVPHRDQTMALIDAGVPTPPALGANARRQFIAHAEASGEQLASLRGRPDYISWMEPLAGTLHQLQSVALPEVRAHSLSDEIAVINDTAIWIERIAPNLAPRLVRLSDDITARLANMDERMVTCHGDFYDDQALVGEAGVIIIDLDELKRGHPLLDVGNMLAHLASGEARGEDVGEARDAFLGATLRQSPHCLSDVAVFEAAALLKLAPGPFRRLEPDWPDGIEHIVELAESRLAGRPPEVSSPPRTPPTDASPAGAAPRGIPASPQRAALAVESALTSTPQCLDPALPQLGDLLSPDVMSQRFTDALGSGQVSVAGIEVVRHKIGRRAILRYQLEANRQTEVVYGKTFASRRGPKVHAITGAITSAKAFGPEVAMPGAIAYLPDLKLLVQRFVAGESIVPDLLDGDTYLAERIAEGLHHFHASALDLGRSHDLQRELHPLEMRVEQVGEHAPSLHDPARSCLVRIHSAHPSNFSWRHAPMHRDFYHDQILIDDGKLAVLDLDDASMSEPAIDVANFGAHLILLAALRPEHASNLASARRSFTGHYRALDHDLDGDLLRFLTATTLLRLAGIHVSRTNGEAIARSLLTYCQRLLKTINHMAPGLESAQRP